MTTRTLALSDVFINLPFDCRGAVEELMQAGGESLFVPRDPLEVRLQNLTHRKLAGGGKVDQLAVAIQEHLAGIGTQLRPPRTACVHSIDLR